MESITKNTKVAYKCGNFEYRVGTAQCKPNHNEKVLVKFDIGYIRWVNVKNLSLVTKTK